MHRKMWECTAKRQTKPPKRAELKLSAVTVYLWRMCFGLFIAAGSFFLGPSNRPLRMLSAVGIGQHLSPVFFSTGLYLILTVFPLLLLIVWLVRLTEAPLGPTNPENADPTASHPCSDRCADR
jgi:hypothetical protein